jgi:hypothetical protein
MSMGRDFARRKPDEKGGSSSYGRWRVGDARRRPKQAARMAAEPDIGKVQPGSVADEGSFWGNRQNVFERGLAQAERVVLAPSPAH